MSHRFTQTGHLVIPRPPHIEIAELRSPLVHAGGTLRNRLLSLPAVCFALALVSAAASHAQTNTYTISGEGSFGNEWCVDDNLNVFAGGAATGTPLFTTGTSYAECHAPFTFMAKQGDSITDQVIDTYGDCTSMSALYLSCNSSSVIKVDPGFNLGCGHPVKNNGQSYIYTYTIPSLPGCGIIPIAAVEFTQAIQQYQSLADLKNSLLTTAEPLVPIVAGKPTAMRIYFSPVPSVTTYAVNVTGAVTGAKTTDFTPGCTATDQRAGNHSCQSMDFYFTPPVGIWSATLTVTDTMGNQLETEKLEIVSRLDIPINLIGVAGCDALYSTLLCGKPSALLNLTSLVKRLMPTNSVTAHITPQRVSRDVNSYSSLGDWLDAMVAGTAELYRPKDAAADAAGPMKTDYVALYRQAVFNTGIADLGGNGITIPDNADAAGPNSLSMIEHEVGHTLGLVHTPIDIPQIMYSLPPGCWGPGASVPDFPPVWTYPTNNIQSSTGLEYGFDVANHKIVNAANTYELMAYCMPQWISPINYKLAIIPLNPNNGVVNSPNAIRTPVAPVASATPRPATAPSLVQGAYWNVSGTIPSTGATLDPIFTETIDGFTDQGSGSYSIQAMNGAGQSLYTRYFGPVLGLSQIPADLQQNVISDPHFSEWIPVTAGTASIAVLDPLGNVLTSVPLTGLAPTVTITSPATGFVGTGVQTISWTIQSATATSFTSRIFYSTDGGTTWEQLDELTGTNDSFDFSTLPGAAAALFRIDVSDGMNTGSATSIPFNVPRKLPSAIVIDTPTTGAIQPAVDPIFLSGSAYDADDGVLTGTALAWSDNVAGALGTGSPLAVTLQPGPHTITLTATDSDGNAITANTSITLGGGRPVVSLTTSTLSTNCVSATINATPGNQGAALSTVQYSLDGGSTYMSVPLNALPYSFIVPGSTPETLFALAQDASQQSAAQSTVVALTGACTAGSPTLFGGSPQATTVGSTFTTPLSALVSDANGNPVAGASVNFTAPATGASATITPATATTGANGVATATATANSTTGSYTVVASVTGFATTAQFNLTNTDFSMLLSNSSVIVEHGSSAAANVTIAPLSGFNSTVVFACAGLPDGVTCSFSPTSVTPNGGSVTGLVTFKAAGNARGSSSAMVRRIAAGSLALALCFLVPGLRRRKKRLGIFMFIALALGLASANGCGSSFHPFSSSVTVTATSGSLTHSSSVSLAVQ